MLKGHLTTGIVLILYATSFTGLFLVNICDATGNTIYVDDDGGKDYTTIQEAIDNASNGDTIYVYGGTYIEDLVINKQITLQGEDKEYTIIIDDIGKNGIEIIADYVNLQSFKITSTENVDYLLYINSNYVTIQGNLIDCRETKNGIYSTGYNNIISGNTIRMKQGEGIRLESCSDSSIIYNDIYGYENWGNAIRIYKCFSGIEISSNNLRDTGDGISVGETNGINIKDNTIIGETGIHLWSNSKNGVITGNVIIDNSSSYAYEIVIGGSSNNNRIYQNSFLDDVSEDKKDAYDDCNNYWYNPSTFKGNYWDNYRGMDGNDDDIGDIPYNISGGDNQDLYPLGKFNNPPDKPSNLYPLDSATDVNLSIRLRVDVFDPDGDTMKVSFYDASNNNLIGGYSYIVESGRTAESELLSLDYNTTLSWYVVVIESELKITSDIFTFTTILEPQVELQKDENKSSADEDNHMPIADANGPYFVDVNGSIKFDASKSYDPDGFIVSYEWDFDDGTTGTGVSPNHTYNKAGTYGVTLLVTDNQSLTDTDTTTVTVLEEKSTDAPGFELILAIVSIVFILIWKRRG